MILYEIKQRFKGEKLTNIRETVRREMKKNKRLAAMPEKSRIAVTAGSRGIQNIAAILREVVSYLKDKGFDPFIVAAMGSHGGATAEGQREVLQQLGITGQTVGAPILSSMETIQLGTTPDQLPVYMDRHAFEADGIIVVNRVKAHTAFHGKVESGLSKMITIGLGKQKGASFVHSQGSQKMEHNIIAVSKYALKHAPIIMGLAIVENGYDETSIIEGVAVEEWHQKEAALLQKSKEFMPALPITEIDVLIVEEMGKNYSGTGMDPNIIGRMRIDGFPEPAEPDIKKILVLDLSEESHGNAQGIGLADFTTDKLVQKIDRKATYMNAITSTFLKRAMIPLYYPTEQEALDAAMTSLGPDVKREEIHFIQIPNTLHLDRLYVSEKVLQQLEKQEANVQVIRKFELEFADGALKHRLLNE